jgi:transcriptional regulator NrdR family protein
MKSSFNLCDCGGKLYVTDSRVYGAYLRRRRCCHDCGRRETTIDIVLPEAGALMIEPNRTDGGKTRVRISPITVQRTTHVQFGDAQ